MKIRLLEKFTDKKYYMFDSLMLISIKIKNKTYYLTYDYFRKTVKYGLRTEKQGCIVGYSKEFINFKKIIKV